MGMYTEFFFRAELHKDTPPEVIQFLGELFGDGNYPVETPGHPFFSEDRWQQLFFGGSAYFPAEPASGLSNPFGWGWELGIHSNFKHYGNEIDQFLDWINPYVGGTEGSFLGYSLYEESDQPHLYFKRRVAPFRGPVLS